MRDIYSTQQDGGEPGDRCIGYSIEFPGCWGRGGDGIDLVVVEMAVWGVQHSIPRYKISLPLSPIPSVLASLGILTWRCADVPLIRMPEPVGDVI